MDLNLAQDMTDEEKYRQTADIGSFAATLEPYFTRLDEVYLVTKSSLYLPSLELTMETVFIVSHMDVSSNTFSTKLFSPMLDGTEMMGVRCVATEVESYGIDPTHAYELLKTFISRYRKAQPKNVAN